MIKPTNPDLAILIHYNLSIIICRSTYLRFNAYPNSPTASKKWKYWLRTLQNFINSLNSNSNNTGNNDKLNLLINLVSPAMYEYIADCTTYDEAIS